MERVMIFIDGSNFYHGLIESAGRASLDFRRFAEDLCGTRRLVHVHYYNVPIPQADGAAQYAGQQKFLAALRRLPYFTVHLGRIVYRTRDEQCPRCGNSYRVRYRTEKGVDVQIASHMLTYAFDDQFDTAILVSQDGDFAPVVAEVERLKKRVENAEFTHRLPSFLSKQCSEVIELTEERLRPSLF